MNSYTSYRRRRYQKLKKRLARAVRRSGFLLQHQRLFKVLQRYARRLALPTLTTAALLGITAPQTWGQCGQVGGEFRVNPTTPGDQEEPAVATSLQGNTVIVYEGEDADQSGIYFRRYDINGQAVGSETRVNQVEIDEQTSPDIALDDDGNFTVVWQSNNQDGSDLGVYGRRYDAVGNAVSNEFQINTYTTRDQGFPKIAMDGEGDFVVVWLTNDLDGSGSAIYGRQYDASGNVASNEFQINTYTTGYQLSADVAMDGSGDFVVAWTSYGQGGAGANIYGQRFTAGGAMVGSEFRVNTYTTNYQISPAIATDTDGDFTVVWQRYGSGNDDRGIHGQRFDNLGNPAGSEFQVNTYTTLGTSPPTLAYNQEEELLVVWEDISQDGSSSGIYARRYDPTGNPSTAEEFRVNTYITDAQEKPAVAVDGNGKFIVVWESEGQDGSERGVYAQRFFFGEFLVFDALFKQPLAEVVSLGDGDFIVVHTEYNSEDNDGEIYGQRFTSTGFSGSLTGSEFCINTYTTSAQSNPDVASGENGSFIVVWESSQDGSGTGIYGQRFDETNSPVGSEFQVNSHTTSNQFNPAVASDSDGNFIVVWESEDQDGSGSGIYGQIYNQIATPVGSEFRVNTNTTSNQFEPAIASNSNGNYVIVWSSGSSINGQRYGATGATVGNEFQVADFADLNRLPRVALDDLGNFMVTWSNRRTETYDPYFGDPYDITFNQPYGRRYNAAGNPIGNSFQIVRTKYTNSHNATDVTANGSDSFTVVWDASEIYGKCFDPSDLAGGETFLVNTCRTNKLEFPLVEADRNGDFVVMWSSRGHPYDYNINFYARPYQNKIPACTVNPLNLSGTQNTNLIYHTAATITSNQTITSTAEVEYRAAESITLNAGFSVQAGARFTATIEDCPNTQPLVPPSTSAFARTTEVTPRTIHPTELTVFPNPARQSFTFTVPKTEVVKSVRLLNQLGQEVQQVDATQRELLVENLQRGMYYLVVQTETGQLVKAVVKE